MAESTTNKLWSLTQRAAAAGALLTLAPALGAISLAVKVTSPGPIFFKQRRPGRHGKPFDVYKFRTMRVGAEKDAKRAQGVQMNDPLITPIGKLLRETKLDELPQLLNVARGEMELVGPRPIAIGLHEKLCKEIPGFESRLDVAPGLTNVGQVSVLENAVDDKLVDDWRQRFEADLHYIRNKSAAYDIVTLGMTTLFMVRKAMIVTRKR